MATIYHTDGRKSTLGDFTLETLQNTVGGYIEHLEIYAGHFIMNEDGTYLNLPPNQQIKELYHLNLRGPVIHLSSEEWNLLNKED